jgi:hypothetical protein
MANFWLRRARHEHHRTSLNPAREYRTYTYSASGYRKLLRESGFVSELHWAYPGYNQPYSVVPLENQFVQDQLLANISDPFLANHRGSIRWVKRAAAACGLFRYLVPDFLIFARKSSTATQHPAAAGGYPGRFWQRVAELQGFSHQEGLRACLYTLPFSRKTVLRIFPEGAGEATLVVKTSTPALNSIESIQAEYANLGLASSCFAGRSTLQTDGATPAHEPRAQVGVPRLLGSFSLNKCYCSAETGAPGQPISRLFFLQPRFRRRGFLARYFPGCARVAVDVAQRLRGMDEARPVEEEWWNFPAGMEEDARLLQVPEIESGPYADWVQHGDLTAENLFLDHRTQSFTVIDWQLLMRGVPPLYDFLCFALSLLHAAPSSSARQNQEDNDLESRFLSTFFLRNSWSSLVWSAMRMVCRELGIPQDEIWRVFVHSLLIRANYQDAQGSGLASVHRRFLHLAMKHRDNFVQMLGSDL